MGQNTAKYGAYDGRYCGDCNAKAKEFSTLANGHKSQMIKSFEMKMPPPPRPVTTLPAAISMDGLTEAPAMAFLIEKSITEMIMGIRRPKMLDVRPTKGITAAHANT